MKKISFLIIVFLFLASCGGFRDAGKVLRNEKVNSTDEFLVKKRNPLVLPPDYNEVPEPGSASKEYEDEEDRIKKILRGPKAKNIIQKKSSSVEDSILNRIRK